MPTDITDLRATIVPKSDQLNSEQLLGGPIDIVVTDVRLGSTEEQPISVHYEGEGGRPFKPCKTMRKVLIFGWGPDGREWIGRSMRLYCDPQVKFGGAEVGGIRISHMSHIQGTMKVSLTATKGKKTLHTIERMEPPQAQTKTLAEVLKLIPTVKGQKGKQAAEALIEQLQFEDQITATEALTAHIDALKSPAA